MIVKLVKNWVDAEDEIHVKGTVLEMDDATAKALIEDGRAEESEGVVTEVKAADVAAEVKSAVAEALKAAKVEAEEEVVEKDVSITVGEKEIAPEVKLMNTYKLAKALKTNTWNAETKAIAGQGETVAADGGALVDTEIVDGIYANAIESSKILSKVSQRAVSKNHNAMQLKQLNESDIYNGVALNVIAEGAQISAQKLAYTTASANVNKLCALIPMSSEILEDDAHGILAFTEKQVGDAYGIKLDSEILYGTDSLVTAAVGDAGSVAVSLADASDPTIAEIHQMYAAQKDVGQAEWYMSGAVYENINQQESTSGGPVIVPNYAVSPFGSLLGRPVNVVAAMRGANGEAGTIGLCNWKDGYVIGTKGGVKMARSISVYFDSDQEVFRWILRVAGLPTKATTMTLADARTVSPLVFGNDS